MHLQLLLSASMDKTVRLWDMETRSCLKLFAHNDYGKMPKHAISAQSITFVMYFLSNILLLLIYVRFCSNLYTIQPDRWWLFHQRLTWCEGSNMEHTGSETRGLYWPSWNGYFCLLYPWWPGSPSDFSLSIFPLIFCLTFPLIGVDSKLLLHLVCVVGIQLKPTFQKYMDYFYNPQVVLHGHPEIESLIVFEYPILFDQHQSLIVFNLNVSKRFQPSNKIMVLNISLFGMGACIGFLSFDTDTIWYTGWNENCMCIGRCPIRIGL